MNLLPSEETSPPQVIEGGVQPNRKSRGPLELILKRPGVCVTFFKPNVKINQLKTRARQGESALHLLYAAVHHEFK